MCNHNSKKETRENVAAKTFEEIEAKYIPNEVNKEPQ